MAASEAAAAAAATALDEQQQRLQDVSQERAALSARVDVLQAQVEEHAVMRTTWEALQLTLESDLDTVRINMDFRHTTAHCTPRRV